MKTINFRFANPTIVSGKLLLDIEASSTDLLKIFGINLRFFYDTRIFKPALTTNTDFKLILESGYKQYNPFNANSPTGWAMFGSTGPITYINTAVELTTPAKAISVGLVWTKVLQFQVTPKVPLVGEQCPTFIFDKSTYLRPADIGKEFGGFLNSAGITCTEYLRTENGEMRTESLVEAVEHMNWEQNPAAVKYPWGLITRDHCFEMSNIF